MAPSFRPLALGEPAPWFHAPTRVNPRFAFDTLGGRYLLMGFYGTARDEVGARALAAISGNLALFDGGSLAFFGVSADPSDRDSNRAADLPPGVQHFWDFDLAVARAWGAAAQDGETREEKSAYRRVWILLDPSLRVRNVWPMAPDGAEIPELLATLRALPPLDSAVGFALQAPILVLPDVFEPGLCKHLISLYEAAGGAESGFMREVGGKTVAMSDPRHKKRKDYHVEDEALIQTVQNRILRKVAPQIAKAHQFQVTRMERYLVGCYAAEDGGHFSAHRDNTTKGTAHRRFAVSINLNDDFDGGEVGFPEYGPRSFKAPPGGAVVFSCSLLHAVSRVTRGRRYAFLPFLYDEAAAKIRAENLKFVDLPQQAAPQESAEDAASSAAS